jgi:hypothetical protein
MKDEMNESCVIEFTNFTNLILFQLKQPQCFTVFPYNAFTKEVKDTSFMKAEILSFFFFFLSGARA